MADEFYFSIKGKTQGPFKGDATQEKKKEAWIKGFSFDYEVTASHDVATGQASGKKSHGLITVVKACGAATPQVFTAATKNETLSEVVFEFYRIKAADGTRYVYQTIKLTDATVSKFRLFTSDPTLAGDASAKHSGGAGTSEFEQIGFSFTKITLENVEAKMMA